MSFDLTARMLEAQARLAVEKAASSAADLEEIDQRREQRRREEEEAEEAQIASWNLANARLIIGTREIVVRREGLSFGSGFVRVVGKAALEIFDCCTKDSATISGSFVCTIDDQVYRYCRICRVNKQAASIEFTHG